MTYDLADSMEKILKLLRNVVRINAALMQDVTFRQIDEKLLPGLRRVLSRM